MPLKNWKRHAPVRTNNVLSELEPFDILIVDDDAQDRLLIKDHLTEQTRHINIHEASHTEEALSLLKNNAYHCIFLDYLLPDDTGINLLKKLQDSNTRLAPCPVVMLTGQIDQDAMIDAYEYGAQDYLSKNHISKDNLFIALKKARHIYQLQQSHNTTQTQLIQAQKMEAIGRLAGGVAHDFNNLLTIILGNASIVIDMLERENYDFPGYLRRMQAVESASKRGADLVKHLMIFSRQKSLEPVTLSLDKLVEDTLNLLKRTFAAQIKINVINTPDLWTIKADVSQMENALINMCMNARDAMLEGGTLTIETKNHVISPLTSGNMPPPGEYVILRISDTGSGMPDKIKDKIFEPFFTTKDVGQGTGLGMSMVYGFVKDSGGFLHVESFENQGTTFYLYFPAFRTKTKGTKKKKKKKPPFQDQTSKTILLVEDEDEIRTLAKDLIESYGYRVISFKTGDEALEFLTENTSMIDLLFTDVMLPGQLNGIQLARKASITNPRLKIIFTTGYAQDNLPDYQLLKEYTLIQKPYQSDVLENMLNTALAT